MLHPAWLMADWLGFALKILYFLLAYTVLIFVIAYIQRIMRNQKYWQSRHPCIVQHRNFIGPVIQRCYTRRFVLWFMRRHGRELRIRDKEIGALRKALRQVGMIAMDEAGKRHAWLRGRKRKRVA